MKKLSVIRGTGVAICPYGLKIIDACKDAGNSVKTMMPLEEADTPQLKAKAARENKITYITQKEKQRCPYANDILEKFDKVDCSFGDSAAGEGVSYLPSSPLYPKNFIGDGLAPGGGTNKGQDVYDPRLYFEGTERDLLPEGMYNVFASRSNEQSLLKMAETTNKFANIKGKLDSLRNKYFDVIKAVVPNKVVKLNQKQLEQLLVVINDWTK